MRSQNNQVLITGAAGFIGFHITEMLLMSGTKCVGIDNMNNYYDKNLKILRLNKLKKFKNFKFFKIDLSKKKSFKKIEKFEFDLVINLAAQAGVRYAFKKPESYIKSNIFGFSNLLEFSKNKKIKKIIFASTSSVYGDVKKYPWSESDNVKSPLTIYSSSKIFNENLAYSYSKYYNMQVLGLRFFTVYGKYGRPDMSIYKFTKNILKGRPITVFNKGNHTRDFTHIDIIKDVFQNIIKQKKWNEIFKNKNHEILNIAGGDKIKLLKLIELIEKNCQKKSIKKFLGLQMGDIKETHANLSKLKKYNLLNKNVPIEKGLSDFVKWYKNYELN
tara:strand:+ start:2946 stop:3935 length:990 start_codon:yes stop_codon:yes gene_type:complete